MAKSLKVGVISANWGMAAHLPAWHAIDGVEVVAVCTSRRETAEAAAAQFGIRKAYWDHAAMAADPDLDIIDVGTRPDLRRGMVLEAIERKKHVFAAANFAADLDGAREMRDAARAAGIVAVLDSTIAQAPANRLAGTMIADGYLGKAVTVAIRHNISLFNGPAPYGDFWRWFAKASHGASAMRNLGTHNLHLLLELLGPIEAVTAQATIGVSPWRFPNGDEIVPEVVDTAQLLLRFESGVLGSMITGWATPASTGWRMEVSGDRGTLVSDHPGPFPSGSEVRLLAGRDAAEPVVVPIPQALLSPSTLHFADPPAYSQSYDIACVMRSMVDAIREGARASPDFERAYHVEEVLECARLAIEQQRWVHVSELAR